MFIIPELWRIAFGLTKIDDYYLGDGMHCVLISDTDGERITGFIDEDLRGAYPNTGASARNSNLAGIKFIVSKLMPNAYMDALVDDQTRPFVNDISATLDEDRFTIETLMSTIADILERRGGEVAPAIEAEPAAPAPAPAPIPDSISRIVAAFGNSVIMELMGNNKHVIYPSRCGSYYDYMLPLIRALSDVADKHVCIISNNSHLLRAQTWQDHKDVLFLVFADTTMTGKIVFTDPITTDDAVTCLGQKCEKLFIPKKGREGSINPYSLCGRIWVDESNGVVFALKVDGFVYITVRVDDYTMVFDRLMTKWSKDVSTKEEDMRLQERAYDMERSQFLNIATANANIYIDDIKKQCALLSEKIGELQSELVETMKMYRQLNEIIVSFDYDAYYAKIRSSMENQFDMIKKMANITSFNIDDSGIIRITTKEIRCKDTRTNKIHSIGRLSISLNILSPTYSEAKSIVIKNLTHMVEGFNGDVMVAPHIYKAGNICHGNLSRAVIQQYANRDVYGLVESILAFVETANVDDLAGKAVNNWPVYLEPVDDEDEFTKNINKGVV